MASSQITLRAVRVGGAGGQITLTNGVALEPGVPQPPRPGLTEELAMMRVDRRHPCGWIAGANKPDGLVLGRTG